MITAVADQKRRDDDGGQAVAGVDVQRYDRGTLRPMAETAEGYLLAEGFFAKPGILVYRNADGTETRELVPEETLHDAESLGTMGRKPVTLEHPIEDVGPGNVNALGVGDVGSQIAVVAGGFVRVEMAIRNDAAIRAVRAGTHELSPGYRVHVDPTPGVHPTYGRYDAIQRNRRYNHLAITERARGGRSIKMRADSAIQTSEPTGPNAPQGAPDMRDQLIEMFTARGIARKDAEAYVDGMITKAGDKGAQDAPKLDSAGIRAAFDAVLGKLDEALSQVEATAAERDAFKAKADEFDLAKIKAKEEEDKGDAAKIDAVPLADRLAWSKDRAQIERLAVAHKIDAADIATTDTDDLRRMVVAAALGDKARTDADPGYYVATCDHLAAQGRADAAPYAGAFNRAPIPAPAKRADADDKAPPVVKHDSYAASLAASFEARRA